MAASSCSTNHTGSTQGSKGVQQLACHCSQLPTGNSMYVCATMPGYMWSCGRFEPYNRVYVGLLQPLPVPADKWDSVNMKFQQQSCLRRLPASPPLLLLSVAWLICSLRLATTTLKQNSLPI